MSDPMRPDHVVAAPGLIDRVKSILLQPSATWDVIAAEPTNIKSIYLTYVIPLAAIGPIATALGMMAFRLAFGTLGGFFLPAIVSVLAFAVASYLLALVMVYLLALVIDGLAPNFGGQKNMTQAFKVATYSLTAGWVAGIVALIPALAILAIVALIYNLYLLYLGLPKLMKSAPEKSLSYTAVVVLVSIVLFIVVGAILTPLRGLGGLATMGGLWAPRPAVISTIGVQGGTATVNLGQLQAAANQMAAQTSALQNSTAAPVKSADPQALLALMPQSFQGSALANPSTSSGGVAGMNASSATASYSVNGGTITLKIADSGSMAAVGGMLQAVNLNTSTSSAGGYEKVSSQNGQMVTEKYDTADKSGEYGIVLNGRTSIEADGSNVDMPTIKSLVAMIDIGKAQSLTK